MIEIPWKSLPPETLDALLEEIVTRDGTDYGAVEKTTAQKQLMARRQLEAGYVLLLWNDESESASLVSREESRSAGLV